MTFQATFLVDVGGLSLSEENGKPTSWVHVLPLGSYKHPTYGTIDVTPTRVARFVENVKNQVRGIDPSINYLHQGDGEAAGWIKGAEARSDGLWAFVEWTSSAAQKLKEKAFKYFSAEIFEEWEDPQGQRHSDVLFGGALTNRPFMKNMVPLNLSEATVDNAFELVSVITGTDMDSLKGGKMELSEEQVDQIAVKLAEKMGVKAPGGDDGDKKNVPDALKLSEIADLKKLAEDNPLVAGLVKHLENQGISLAETAQKLRETQVTQKMSEFDRASKLVLTPATKKLIQELVMEMPQNLSEKFWDVMNQMRTSQGFLVELGERTGASVKFGEQKTAQQRFSEMVNEQMANGKDLSYPDAVENVAKANPSLWEEYRQETFIN